MAVPGVRDRPEDTFDVYYINDDINKVSDDISIKKIIARKPSDDILYIYSNELNNLVNFDIKNFSFIIFEEDINRLDDSEFEYFWKKLFEPWLVTVNEEYLDIDIENFKFQLNSTLEKKYLVKKLVHFIMYIIPYLLLKKIFNEYSVETKSDYQDLIGDMFRDQPYRLKEQLVSKIDEVINYSKNFLKTISEVVKHSKKNTLEDMTGLLENQVDRQNDYYDIFKKIIDNTINEKLFKLVDLLVQKDFENIV